MKCPCTEPDTDSGMKSVVTNPLVPRRVRHSLNLESGLILDQVLDRDEVEQGKDTGDIVDHDVEIAPRVVIPASPGAIDIECGHAKTPNGSCSTSNGVDYGGQISNFNGYDSHASTLREDDA